MKSALILSLILMSHIAQSATGSIEYKLRLQKKWNEVTLNKSLDIHLSHTPKNIPEDIDIFDNDERKSFVEDHRKNYESKLKDKLCAYEEENYSTNSIEIWRTSGPFAPDYYDSSTRVWLYSISCDADPLG